MYRYSEGNSHNSKAMDKNPVPYKLHDKSYLIPMSLSLASQPRPLCQALLLPTNLSASSQEWASTLHTFLIPSISWGVKISILWKNLNLRPMAGTPVSAES